MKLCLRRVNGGRGNNPAAEEGNEDNPEARRTGWETEPVTVSRQGSRMSQQRRQAGRNRKITLEQEPRI